MADNKSGGKKGRKVGRNKEKCAAYAAAHRMTHHKFSASKEHRACGPIGYYTRLVTKTTRPVHWTSRGALFA